MAIDSSPFPSPTPVARPQARNKDKHEDADLPKLRISSVLMELKEKEGSYLKLEKSIANFIDAFRRRRPEVGDDAYRAIERRKLKRIAENDRDITLSIAELRGLDVYLEELGQSLAVHPLFEKPELLRSIAESQHALFVLGAKADDPDDPDEMRFNISSWDMKGLSWIQARVQDYGKNLLLEIREERVYESLSDARKNLETAQRDILFDKTAPSVVCIASSISNQMTEPTLCAMTNFEPWSEGDPQGRLDLPFHFVWPKDRDYVLPSRFHLYGEDAALEDEEAGQAVLERGGACFRVGGRYLIDELSQKGRREGDTYALCAAQRRENGQIWLLVAGLTGPATYAAARWVPHMPARFQEHHGSGPHSDVAWYVIRTRATLTPDSKGSAPQVDDAEIVYQGTI